MCGETTGGRPNAAASVAALMRRDLNVDVSEAQVRLFVLARWDRIKLLAHAIHDLEAAESK
ncbi:hypothetical protein BMW22_15705 [Rhizobium leguminosarum]|uniref:Uncharacterized protein n=1 Tax=Rhizobium leguminosarum TaxID=384 RepID=A0A1L3ZBD8_RHILE|nr:hypothetical protein [Rhizobium leguminosarum]API52870.1 hypothetical protein BMW22_15705 [Rhizobium leguminosarum]